MKFKQTLKHFPNKDRLLLVIMVLTALTGHQLKAQQRALSVFEPLMGRTWEANGTWGDGTNFKQEIAFEYSLDSTLVITQSKGFTNQEQSRYGHRNHGIRKLDNASNTIVFWEFDVFGGVTQGKVTCEGKNIYYQYPYGESVVTDLWEFIDHNTYNFIVGDYSEGEWKQKYLETQFIASKTDFDFHFDHQSLVVTKLIETGDFYRDILKMEEIPHPDKAPGFRWFQIRGNSQLHLIKKEMIAGQRDKSMHLCLSTQNLEAVIEHLIKNNIDFYDWPGNKGAVTNRSDGVKQIYLQDPDGYWVEINTANH